MKEFVFNIGAVTILGGMRFTLDSNLSEASPQFTLICISTGGPATTVTWTRGSVTVTEGNETVLDNPVTAQYTHTLTVTGRLGGLYTCTVANNKPSKDSAQLIVQGTLNSCMFYFKCHLSIIKFYDILVPQYMYIMADHRNLPESSHRYTMY